MSSKPSSEHARTLGVILVSKNHTVSTAESCTGGMIGAALTSVPGSSVWFKGGIIAYDNLIKISLLGVPQETLDNFGAVSEQTVAAMAQGAARILHTDCAISVSGIAGPNGGTPEKPVGLVFIGICVTGNTTVYKHLFSGNREAVRRQAVAMSLKHCSEAIRQ